MTNANISDPQSFEASASMLHEQALFNPNPQTRDKALKQIRANSAFTPQQWAKFDVAAGIRTKDEVKELFADSSMPVNSWIEYGNTSLDQHEKAPSTLNYLLNAGFSTPSTLSRYAHVQPMRSGEMDADVNMNARARSRQDLPSYGLDGVALPIVHSDWEIDSREFQQSQAFGEDLDAKVASDAREAIEETEDDLLFNGWNSSVKTDRGAFGVDGLAEDSGKVLTGSATDWGTAANVIDTLEAIQQQIEGQASDGRAPSPRQSGAIVFIPTAQMTEITLADYETSATDEPLMDRLNRKFPYLTFVEAPSLASGEIVYMLNDRRYFEIVNAQGMTNTSWDVDGGFGRRSKMMASRIPWVKEQPDGIYGIAYYTGA